MAAPAYNMYSAAPDYSRTRKTTRRGHEKRKNVRIVRGRGDVSTHRGVQTHSSESTLPVNVTVLVVAVAVLFVGFALLSFARVAISSATIATSMETQQITSSLETARSEGNQLEVDASVVSNASSVKVRAKALGMSTPESTEIITLPEDVVAQDSDGNLMLSESIRRAGNVEENPVSLTDSTSSAN